MHNDKNTIAWLAAELADRTTECNQLKATLAEVTRNAGEESERHREWSRKSISANWVLNALAGHSYPNPGQAYDAIKNRC
jgi:hypothetical protein